MYLKLQTHVSLAGLIRISKLGDLAPRNGRERQIVFPKTRVGQKNRSILQPRSAQWQRSLLALEALGKDEAPDEAMQARLMDTTYEIVEIILNESKIPGFWKPARIADQERLKGRVFEELFASRLLDATRVEATVDKLLELARANHERLMRL